MLSRYYAEKELLENDINSLPITAEMLEAIITAKEAALLILDDLGAELKTEWSTCFLYEIIDARYRSGKPTIVTTNLTLRQLREHLTDKNGIPRTFDRLVEGLTPVEFQCRNYRKEQAKANKSGYDFFEDIEE